MSTGNREAVRRYKAKPGVKERLAEKRRRYTQNHPDRVRTMQRKGDLRRHFGLSIEAYDALLSAQGGVCAVCKQLCATGKRLAVDHNHATRKIRGLLCTRCNPMLGYAQDDPQRLIAGAQYLLTKDG